MVSNKGKKKNTWHCKYPALFLTVACNWIAKIYKNGVNDPFQRNVRNWCAFAYAMKIFNPLFSAKQMWKIARILLLLLFDIVIIINILPSSSPCFIIAHWFSFCTCCSFSCNNNHLTHLPIWLNVMLRCSTKVATLINDFLLD